MSTLDKYFEEGLGIIRKNLWIPLNNRERNERYKEMLLQDLTGQTLMKKDIPGPYLADLSHILFIYEFDIKWNAKPNEKYGKIAFTIVSEKEGRIWYHVFYELERKNSISLDNFMYAYFSEDFGKSIKESIFEKCPFHMDVRDTGTTLTAKTSRITISHDFASKEAAVLALIGLLEQEERWLAV